MKVTSVKIEDEDYERAKTWCEEHDRALGYLIRLALRQFLDSNN